MHIKKYPIKQKTVVMIFAIALAMAAFAGGFWYVRKPHLIVVDEQPKIVYKVSNFDAQGAFVKADYRSVNIDGSDDKLVYSTPTYGETLKVLGHRDIGIGTSTANIFFDKNGKDIEDIYRDISRYIGMASYDSPAYSIDGNMVAVIGRAQNEQPEIHLLNVQEKQTKKFLCAECKNYQAYHAIGFSRDGKRLYFYVARDRANHPVDADPDLKYLYINLESGGITNVNISHNTREVYDFYPQYDLALKRSAATYGTPGSIDLVNLSDMSEKQLVDDLGESGELIFNGKDVVYTTFSDRSIRYYPEQEVKGVNIRSGERYPILPPHLVNTAKIGEKELIGFLPDSAKFIYTIQHDSGWELRMHDIDTGEDRIILNLTAERFADKTFYFKQYVGIVF